jgi:hypothetical protein
MPSKDETKELFKQFFENAEQNNGVTPDDAQIPDWCGEEISSTIRLRPYVYNKDMKTKSSREELDTDGTKKKTQGFNHFVAGCGHRVAEPPGHPHLPHVVGICREGHTACSNCLATCHICKTKICEHELWKIVDGKPICKNHKLRMIFNSFIELLTWIFFETEEVDEIQSDRDTKNPA